MNKNLLSVAYFIAGFAILFAGWELASLSTKGELPSPFATMAVFFEMWSRPFYDAGPNDKGIGIQLLASLKRVFVGFGIGTLIAVPVGFLIGSNRIVFNILNPVIQVLKPVSPLAWFPLGLAMMKVSDKATLFVIIITSLWPTLINTALGVASVPQDHKNVGKAFGFSTWKYITKILLPASLPLIITGLRLSISVAWLVIVAAEMLSGGVGIGFFVWDSWNALSLEKVISAILIIGIMGLLLDKIFAVIQKKFTYAI
ncbi:nitrate ABC transporter permease [Pedobacter sp. SYSU D00535]|uniref:nitrate ABC transporter permease n=1 Tax=Pedobacter sp. SYSU D00535 TaxID=2810308 RepID=UPI001A9760C3|nr:nitrate ABC transporter permease [Pedobacter sp. SYSU D00535]